MDGQIVNKKTDEDMVSYTFGLVLPPPTLSTMPIQFQYNSIITLNHWRKITFSMILAFFAFFGLQQPLVAFLAFFGL